MKSLFVVCIVLSTIVIRGQSHIEELGISGQGIELSENGIDSLYRITLHVRVSDTLSTDSLILKIGTSHGSSDFFEKSYTMQETNSLDSPEHIQITPFFIDIVIGDFLLNQIHHYQIELVDHSGVHFSQFNKEM